MGLGFHSFLPVSHWPRAAQGDINPRVLWLSGRRQTKEQSSERVTSVNPETKHTEAWHKNTKMAKWIRGDLSRAGQGPLLSWSEMLYPLAEVCSKAVNACLRKLSESGFCDSHNRTQTQYNQYIQSLSYSLYLETNLAKGTLKTIRLTGISFCSFLCVPDPPTSILSTCFSFTNTLNS